MARERLGEVTVPSGILTLLDPGHIGVYGSVMRDVPAVRIDGVPRDRVLAIVGERMVDGDWVGCWDWVAIEVAAGEIVHAEPHGQIVVDYARVLVADDGNADAWVHDDSFDGRADFVFWGRDAAALAAAVDAPALADGTFGWKDLPIEEIVARGEAAEALKAERGWKLATDFRPHSHHWQALESVRASTTESATIDVDGRQVCLLMTSWGDGVFPVFCDRDADDRLLRVRVQFHTAESDAAMAAVNP